LLQDGLPIVSVAKESERMTEPASGQGILASLLDGSHPRFSLRSLPMPELRKDPIVGRWVIIATERAKRPIGPKNEPYAPTGTACPFCEGQEEKTPQEILSTATAIVARTNGAGGYASYPISIRH